MLMLMLMLTLTLFFRVPFYFYDTTSIYSSPRFVGSS